LVNISNWWLYRKLILLPITTYKKFKITILWDVAVVSSMSTNTSHLHILHRRVTLFYPEDGGIKFLQNIGTHLSNYMVPHPKGLYFLTFTTMRTSNITNLKSAQTLHILSQIQLMLTILFVNEIDCCLIDTAGC
jgi:hypothetical protein